VDDLADRLNQIIAQRGLKASEIADATGITRPVMSRYLANRSGISAENLIRLSQYFNVSPDWLLNGSDAPEAVKMSTSISVDKNETIAVLKKYVANLEKQVGGLEKEVKAWEDMAITISEKNSQKTKNPTKPNKQKVGFMKKHKPKK
jgi:transcriptional regulator with XRE-family HTH domain